MQFKQTQALKTFVNTSEIQFHRDTFANTAMQTYINARMHKVASDLMSERIFSSVSGEASINLEGASRAITLPKDLKEFLLRQGWKNSKVYLVYDDKKKCLIVYSKERLNEIIKQRLGISEKIARKK